MAILDKRLIFLFTFIQLFIISLCPPWLVTSIAITNFLMIIFTLKWQNIVKIFMISISMMIYLLLVNCSWPWSLSGIFTTIRRDSIIIIRIFGSLCISLYLLQSFHLKDWPLVFVSLFHCFLGKKKASYVGFFIGMVTHLAFYYRKIWNKISMTTKLRHIKKLSLKMLGIQFFSFIYLYQQEISKLTDAITLRGIPDYFLEAIKLKKQEIYFFLCYISCLLISSLISYALFKKVHL